MLQVAANLRHTAGLHTLCKQNKNLFHSCGHGSFLQSRSGEPLCIFSPCLWASVLQTQTVNHVRLVDVGEDVNHLQTANRRCIRRRLRSYRESLCACKSVYARYVADVKLTSPTHWRRPSVRWVPSILLISAHSAFFSLMSEFFSSCRRAGNSHRPASKPVNTHTFKKKKNC